MKDPCSTCDFVHAVRFPDGTIKEFNSGGLKDLDEDKKYDADGVKPMRLGFFIEYLGGNLGKLITCLELTQEEEDVEVLVEGRWMRVKLDLEKDK